MDTISNSTSLSTNNLRKIIRIWNDSKSSSPNDFSISKKFENKVLNTPDNIAVINKKKKITYSELNKHANKVAHYLRKIGATENTLIGVYQDSSIEAIVSILAILKAGAAFVPIDVTYPVTRINYMIENAGITTVLSKQGFIKNNNYIDVNSAHILNEYSDKNLKNFTKNTDSIYLIYTSGTTGLPKGAILFHAGVNNLLEWYIDYCSIDHHDKILILSSLSFDLTYKNIFSALLTGSQIHLIDINPFDPDQIIKTIFDNEITFINCTPSLFYTLSEHPDVSNIQSLRMVCLGGEPINSNRLKQFTHASPKTIIANTYGPTECSDLACAYKLSKSEILENKTIPIGKSLPNVKVLILNENLELTSLNEPGELYIAGISVGKGYYNNPEETNKNFIKNPFFKLLPELGPKLYKTGDRAQWLSNGFFQFLGRIDDQIKLRGYRMEPMEIEKAIIEEIDAKQVIVLCNEISETNQILQAYIINDTNKVDITDLRSKLSLKLPEYMIPSKYFTIPSYPQTLNGKLDKKTLLSSSQEIEIQSEFATPRTYVEQCLLSIWSDVLQQNPLEISIHDNFFELGGYSILATQVNLRMKRMFGINMPLDRHFSNPTIYKLAREIEIIIAQKCNKVSLVDIQKTNNTKAGLSFSQQRIWFLSKLLPNSAFYNLPNAFLVQGHFDTAIFIKSLAILADSHKMLKTSFYEINGIPFQQIHENINLAERIETINLNFLEREAAKIIINEKITKDANRSFDLTIPFLLRVKIFILSDKETVLYVNFHHMILDGWSWNIFKKELSQIYNTEFSGKNEAVKTNTIEYIDYVEWQSKNHTADFLQAAQDYWHKHLSKLKSEELPTDFQRPSTPLFKGQRLRKSFPDNIYQKLEKIAQTHHVTFFTILITIFNLVLHRYSNNNQIVIATPVANRPNEQLEKLIGHFINTALFITEIQPELTLIELLLINKVQNTNLLSYQHYPFEKLVENINLKRDITKNPISQIMFSFQNHHTDNFNFLGTTLSFLEIETHYSRFDIEWQVWLEGKNLTVDIFYNTEVYKKETTEDLLNQFFNLLNNLPLNMNTKLIDIYYDSNKLSMIEGSVINSENLLVHQYIEHNSHIAPNEIVLFSEHETLSFKQINVLSNQGAHLFTEMGISKGDYIVILIDRSTISVIIYLACLKLGAVFIPVSVDNPPLRISNIIKNAAPKLVIRNENFRGIASGIDQIETTDLEKRISKYPGNNPTIKIDNNDAAYIIYTSGSTGQPKGVVISHKSLINVIKSIATSIEFNTNSHWLAITTLSFDISLLELFLPLVMGGKLTIASQSIINDPTLLTDKIFQIENLIIQTTPSFWKILLKNNWKNTKNLKIICGGEVLSRHLADSLLNTGAKVWNAYGPTETTIWSLIEPITYGNAQISIGTPLLNTSCYVVNDNQIIVPIGKIGELYIAGDGVALGYLGLPELSADKFVNLELPDGRIKRCFRTGDQVKLLEDGSFQFKGRIDDQVKIKGYRVELSEIEHALTQHPYIDQAAVIIKNQEINHTLSAFVLLNRHPENISLTKLVTNNWKSIFNNLYSLDNRTELNKFDGWISSYNHQPIPTDEMEDWLTCCARLINKLKPNAVLEIGCGLGHLITKLSKSCNQYIATDISDSAIYILKETIKQDNVVIRQASAHNAVNYMDKNIDIVIINSVFQYFPSLEYFENLLKAIIDKISEDSVIFIGDVRGYDLAKFFHASLLSSQNKLNHITCEAIREIEISLKNDKEIIANPSYFLELSRRFPQISFVEIQPKLGVHNNELNKYRFDVFIHIKTKKPVLRPDVTLNGFSDKIDLVKLTNTLKKHKDKICLIENIDNSILAEDFKKFPFLFPNSQNNETSKSYIAPYELYELANSLGKNVKFRLGESENGNFDAIFYPQNKFLETAIFPYVNRNYSMPLSHEPHNESSLIREVTEYLVSTLPHYMLPTEINVIKQFQLSTNGKIDKKVLADLPEKQKSLPSKTIRSDLMEIELSKIWTELLSVESINLEDNFFDVGGYSLLAIQLLSKANQHFGINLLLYDFYKNPTLSGHLKSIKNVTKNSNISISEPVTINKAKPILFIIPPIDGCSDWYADLVQNLKHEYDCVVFNQPFNLLKNIENAKVEVIAEQYLQKIRAFQPVGPYHLLGWSFGGIVSFEICNQLYQQGKSIKNLIMIEAPPPQNNQAIESAQNNIKSLYVENNNKTEEDLSCIIYQNSLAYVNYLLKPIALNKAIIIQADKVINSSLYSNNWTKILNTENIIIKDTDHYSIMKPPYVEQVAKYIIQTMEN